MLSHVLLLSGVIGRAVLHHDGTPAGRLTDLTVSLDGGAGPRLVRRAVVARRNAPTLLVPWEAVAGFDGGHLVLTRGGADRYAVASVTGALGADEILLCQDVLDTQVVDVVGQRLARVADVLLGAPECGPPELIGVEVGFGAVLRRLGVGRLVPGARADVVVWSDLHLTSDRGHLVQLSAPRAAVHRVNSRRLAALVSRVDTDAASQILAAREPRVAAEAVEAAAPEVGERVLRAMPRALAARIVNAMSADHAGRWRRRLSRTPAFFGRRFLRSRVWARRHLRRRNGRRR